jgi:hypothetical protein
MNKTELQFDEIKIEISRYARNDNCRLVSKCKIFACENFASPPLQ